MLFLSDPFYPVFRLQRVKPDDMIRAHCWDVEEGRMIVFTLYWQMISSDDAAELASATLSPEGYQPSDQEFKRWIGANVDRLYPDRS